MTLDITELTSDQLAAIQAQLKDQAKQKRQVRGKRMELIEAMLQAKDEDGAFIHTTRDIATELSKQGLGLMEQELQDKVLIDKELRKIQAKKQHLEKLTDEKGELVHPEGTFGYKSSGGLGSVNMGAAKVKVETIVEFMKTRASELSAEQVAEIRKCL